MSVISISSGNCGVALSSAVYECINQSINNISLSDGDTRDYASSMQEIYFKTDKKRQCLSRSVLIGSDLSNFYEYKQSVRLLKSENNKSIVEREWDWNQDPDLVIEYHENSNNCWAKGYYQSQREEEVIRDYINKEAEQADTLDSFLVYAGYAGGTGSGGSSLLSQILADDYPSTCQTCVGVLPFSSGENAMQSINSMLAITSIYETCNGLILFENDRYDSICKKLFKDSSYSVMNDCIATSLFSNIQPIAETCSISRKTLYRNNVEMMLRNLTSYPKHKILTCRALPVGSRNNLSFENPTHNKLLSQIVESINESLLPFETNETNDVDVDVHFSTLTPTNVQQGSVKVYSSKNSTLNATLGANSTLNASSSLNTNNEKASNDSNSREKASNEKLLSCTKASNETKKNRVYTAEEELYLYRPVREIRIKAPNYLSVKNSVLLNGKGQSVGESCDRSVISGLKKTKGNVRLINTGGGRKKPVKKNIVTSMSINMAGEVDEGGIDFAQHLSQVLFWGHSLAPARACYSPWDGGIGRKGCGIISNCQTPLRAITRSNDTMKMIFASNAYLNKYQTYGVDTEELAQAIIRGEEIVNNYTFN